MSVPRLHEHRDRFTERNLFLHALLGTVSMGRQFTSFVERVADVPVESPGSGASRSVYAVLGVMSLWRRLETELVTWTKPGVAPGVSSPEAGTSSKSASGEHPSSPRRILR